MAGVWEQEVNSFLLTSFLCQTSLLWQPQDLLKNVMSGGLSQHQQMAAWISLPFSKNLFVTPVHAEILLNQTVCLLRNTDHGALHAK